MQEQINKEAKKSIQQQAELTQYRQERNSQLVQANQDSAIQLRQDMLALHQAIGNRAVVQQLAQVQKEGEAGGAADIHSIAAAGVQGASTRLPHYDKIQAAFGKHSIAHVQAYTGKQASFASHAMGAKAYTTGNKVAFAGSNPDLHTTAHETAHVFQQEAGVQLKDNVGIVGDQYEREADAIADSVVQGKSAESQLSRFNHKPHQKNQSVTMRKPVQRLMGIEAELTVPVWVKPAPGANADAIIRQFFTGGVKERNQVEPPNKGFEIVTDHDDLGLAIEIARQNINADLYAAKKPTMGAAANAKYNVANMEYTTNDGTAQVAYDEESAKGLKAFRQSIKDMTADMDIAVGKAKKGVHPTTGGYVYGIPPVNEFINFAKHNGLNQKNITNHRDNFINLINDQLYIQINAGILPKGISKYFNKLSNDHDLAKLSGLPFKMLGQEQAWVNLLTSGAATIAQQALSNTQGPPGEVKRSKSLRGLVALMVANIFGLYFAVRRIQGGINNPEPKNRLAALPKTPLTSVLRELDKTKRPDLWKPAYRNNLKNQIINRVDAYLDKNPVDRQNNKVWAGAVATDAAANKQVDGGPTSWKQWVDNILTNKQDDIFNHLLVVTTLGQVAPHDHPRSKLIDAAKDHPRPPVPPATKAKSGAIVTELRFVGARPSTNELLALVNKAVKTVKGSNK